MSTERDIIAGLVRALKMSQEVGCVDHLDAWPESQVLYYAPLERAEQYLAQNSPDDRDGVTSIHPLYLRNRP